MIRHRTAGLLVTLLASLVVATPAAPVAAEDGQRDYVRGDAPAYMDLVGVTAQNKAHRARMVLRVADLGDRGTFTLAIEHPDGLKGAYARVTNRTDGTRKVEFRRWKQGGDTDPVIRDCDGKRLLYQPARDRIVLSIPQSCLRWYFSPPKAWAFRAYSFSPDGSVRDADTPPLRLRRG